ncbi:hypothetical protein JCM11641_006211 [Rhodosporidiobolus odoratus]
MSARPVPQRVLDDIFTEHGFSGSNTIIHAMEAQYERMRLAEQIRLFVVRFYETVYPGHQGGNFGQLRNWRIEKGLIIPLNMGKGSRADPFVIAVPAFLQNVIPDPLHPVHDANRAHWVMPVPSLYNQLQEAYPGPALV